MTIVVSGKHTDIGESLKKHVIDNLNNVVEKHMNEILEATVIFEKKGSSFKSEISVHVANNFIARSGDEDHDVYTSFNNALLKIETRLKKYKNRLRDKRRKPHELIDNHAASRYVVDNFESDNQEDNPVVIAEMKDEIPTLSVSEAVMKLDLTDSTAIMFKNKQNQLFNTIYRKSDGNIGWISPSQK